MASEATKTDPSDSLDETAPEYVIDRIDWYREVLREDPSSVLFCELAEELCADGLWEEAIRVLREGLHFHPRHLRGHALLGWALWEYGSAEQAEEVLDQVRRELEKIALVYRVLGEISTHRGHHEEAGRLETIHALMRRGMDRPDAQWDAVGSSSPPPGTQVHRRVREEQESPRVCDSPRSVLLDLLGTLKDWAGSGASLESKAVAIFTPEDRKALERLIRAHAGRL